MKNVIRYIALWSIWWLPVLAAGELRIIVTSDIHGELGNFAVLAPAIRAAAEEKPSLIVDLGDTVPGTFYSEYAENSTGMAEALNRAGAELWVPGNHDFELAPESFRDFVRRFKGAALGGDWSFAGVSGRPFVVVERGGVRCAVIGLTDPKMPFRVLPGSDMTFRSPDAVLDELLPRINAARPHVVVLAWHNGLYSGVADPRTLLRRHPGIGVVLGGHSHQEHPGVRLGGGVLYVQPGAYGRAAGVIDIVTDDLYDRVDHITSRLIRGDPRAPDLGLAAFKRRLKSGCNGLRSRRLGSFPPARSRVLQAGSLCAEALRGAALADASVIWLDAEVPEFRQPGELTAGDLYALLPHRDAPCTLTVTRDELTAFVAEHEQQLRRRKRQRMLFGAGIQIRRRPDGGTSHIDAPERFTLAVSEYLIAESRVLRPLVDLPERNFRRIGGNERDLIADYLYRHRKYKNTKQNHFVKDTTR